MGKVSTDVGQMIEIARRYGKPIIFFWEYDTSLPPDGQAAVQMGAAIRFALKEDLIEQLRDEIQKIAALS
jgi:hypothetical protein